MDGRTLGSVDLHSPVLAAKAASGQHGGAVFVTARSMSVLQAHLGLTVSTTDCRGLNGSSLTAALFDSVSPSKAFAVSDAGELLVLNLFTEKQRTDCLVRVRRSAGLGVPARMVPLKGYFLVVSASEVVVFNTSIHARGGAKEVFRDHPGAIGHTFGQWLSPGAVPSVSGSRMNRLLVGLDKGSVAVFHTALPQPFVAQWNGADSRMNSFTLPI